VKLAQVYSGLDAPQPGHATEKDWYDHLKRLDRRVAATPNSITARVALAKSYVDYAWDARGDDVSDAVSKSGWQLFEQRLQKAKTILDRASALQSKCPEWYVAMQQIVVGQSWDSLRATALFNEAVSFEATYDYYYRELSASPVARAGWRCRALRGGGCRPYGRESRRYPLFPDCE
jgi:hypothetical protein